MKRRIQQENVILKIAKTSSLPSSSLIGLDGSNDDSNIKSMLKTTIESPTHDTNNPIIKIEKAGSKYEEKSKLKIEKVTNKDGIDSSLSSEHVKVLYTSKPRVQLKAKRKCTPQEVKQKEPAIVKKKQQNKPIVKEKKDSKETMQMKLLREKIKLRQAQGNAKKKTKIMNEIEIKKEPLPTKNKKRIKKSNNKKLKKTKNNSGLISKKIKQELIDIENQSTGDKNSAKICELKNTIKNIETNTVITDMKLTIGKCKKNSTSVANKVSSVTVKNEIPSVNFDEASLGLSISSSADSKPFMEPSKYVIPKIKKSSTTDINSNQVDELKQDDPQSRLLSALSPPKVQLEYYKNAEERMKALRSRLSAEIEINKAREVAAASNNVSNESNDFYEEMEWEPIEEEKIIYEVHAIRAQLGSGENDVQMKELPYDNSNELTVNTDHTDNAVIYVVIDTNVLLSSIETIEKIRDTSFGVHGKPTIIIPWTVVRELDYIKDDKMNTGTESLKSSARRAIRFLYHHFSIKHPQIKGQKYQDSVNNREQFALECPDDEILQTCLQIRLSNSKVFLLSFDKNLCNKAMIHEVTVLGKEDLIEKINNSFQKIPKKGKVKVENASIKQEIKIEEDEIKTPYKFDILDESEKSPFNVDDIFEETKDILTAFLTVIVSSEMKNMYGDEWEKYTILKPPWTAITVLKCSIKHFLAVTSEALSRKAESILRTLLQLIIKLENNVSRQLKEIQYIIELFNDLIQYVNDANKYQYILRRSTAAIAELRNKCMERLKQQTDVGNRNAEMNSTKEEQEIKVTRAFKCFENIYRFTRNFCGTALEIAGVSCSFQYNKIDSSDDFIKRNCADVAGNLNRIIQALNNILENNCELHINHQYIIELYEHITSFLQRIIDESTSDQLFPEDLYYCLKHKKANLKLGFDQFLELSNHFSYMAQLNLGQ